MNFCKDLWITSLVGPCILLVRKCEIKLWRLRITTKSFKLWVDFASLNIRQITVSLQQMMLMWIVYSNSSLLASKCTLSCLPNKEFLVKDIKKLVHKYLIYLLKNSLNSNHARANNYAWTEVLLMLSKWQITHFHSVALSKKVQLLGRHTVSLRWCARAQQIFEKILVLSSFN